MREFRDEAGVQWAVFFTARSVAPDRHLPEQYREGWLVFESAAEKRRLAPVPKDWDSLSDRELSALCGQATHQAPRKKAMHAAEAPVEQGSAHAEPEVLQPQLRDMETRLSSALDEVCELRPPEKLNTGELIRVEETLALATAAAKEAVSLRRKLRANRDHNVGDRADSRHPDNPRG